MTTVISFFAEYALLIFLLLFGLVIFSLSKLYQSSRERKIAVFSLEIENARKHQNQAVGLLTILLFLSFTELFLIIFIMPGLPAALDDGRPQLMSGSPVIPTIVDGDLTNEYMKVATFDGEVTSGCIPGQVMITFPAPSDQIRGKITIEGSVNIPNLGFYKYEYAPTGSSSWTTIQAGREIRQEQSLGDWDTSELTAGDYGLRLVVSDNQGVVYAECLVQIRIINP